jgi:hypothetical protein
MINVFQQIIRISHLSPILFPQYRLFGLAPEIVVRENSRCLKIEAFGQPVLRVSPPPA